MSENKYVPTLPLPPITDLKTVLQVYYSKIEIDNNDIRRIFGKIANSTISRIKKPVRETMAERSTPYFNAHRLNTVVAFDVWGIDIVDIERRLSRLQKLGLDGGV